MSTRDRRDTSVWGNVTDLLQAVILRGPRVSVAVYGDLHGGCFAHDTVCHRRFICNTSPQTRARHDGVAFDNGPRNPAAAAAAAACLRGC